MIQRIQTLYLILVAGFMLAMLFIPINVFEGLENVVFEAGALGVYQVNEAYFFFDTWPLLIPFLAVVINSLVAVFLYKKRPLQIKLASTNILLLLASYCAIFYYAWSFMTAYPSILKPSLGLLLPLLAFISNLLAIRAIKKDENLIKSLNRIR